MNESQALIYEVDQAVEYPVMVYTDTNNIVVITVHFRGNEYHFYGKTISNAKGTAFETLQNIFN